MKLIAHRGLFNGPDRELENKPEQIELAIKQGFEVEIDVWYVNNKLYLGHDFPEYNIDLSFLQREQIWAHAKDLPALDYMLKHSVHCFWHNVDERTLTSKGYIWTYPEEETTDKSVLVVMDHIKPSNENLYGVCSDYVSDWK
jgi:hypothetical protein